MTLSLAFDPLLGWPLVAALGALAALVLGLGLWRGLAGVWWRAAAFAVILAALAGPVLERENRRALPDIVLALVDESASQGLPGRAAQTEAALAALEARLAAQPGAGAELRVVRVGDAPENGGTRLAAALEAARAAIPRAQLAGVFVISDGRIHDAARLPAGLEVPVHLLLTGNAADWDRRLIISQAPAFAILGEEVTLRLKIEDTGAVPEGLGGRAMLSVQVGGALAQRVSVPVGREMTVPITLQNGGRNTIRFALEEQPGELTARNNAAIVEIEGVRDRLRVLLVSGAPHPGERTWRNLLKSDASVDLVHFTILRPPEKQDGVPASELSLIAFPTRELFLEKIDGFDLIVFDRYPRRGILPGLYFENIADYVRNGGAVLVAAGPDYASAASIYRSPLGAVLPAAPSSQVIEGGFTPKITETGARHPVTAGLEEEWRAAAAAAASAAGDTGEGPGWGRWFRLIGVEAPRGPVVMEGPGGAPLLVLGREGEGRVALLASDHAWLWDRGFEGGGPQLALLRRLAHWMMREPELEEEALIAAPDGQGAQIIRRTLADTASPVTITRPDGTTETLTLEPLGPGRFGARFEAPEPGLYSFEDGARETVAAIGPAAPREFEAALASDELLAPLVAATRGGVARLEEGMPQLRRVEQGRLAAGRGWQAITPRAAFQTLELTRRPLAPAWVWLALAAGLVLAGWLREGRGGARGGARADGPPGGGAQTG